MKRNTQIYWKQWTTQISINHVAKTVNWINNWKEHFPLNVIVKKETTRIETANNIVLEYLSLSFILYFIKKSKWNEKRDDNNTMELFFCLLYICESTDTLRIHFLSLWLKSAPSKLLFNSMMGKNKARHSHQK